MTNQNNLKWVRKTLEKLNNDKDLQSATPVVSRIECIDD